jgi:hypothetical protein
MAVVAITEVKGNTAELLAKYDKVSEKLMARGEPAPGLLVHTCIILDDGIRIANVYESEQRARDGYRDEYFQSALRDAGFTPVEPTIFQAHNHLNFAAMPGGVR